MRGREDGRVGGREGGGAGGCAGGREKGGRVGGYRLGAYMISVSWLSDHMTQRSCDVTFPLIWLFSIGFYMHDISDVKWRPP